jgi:hypothetical protein
MNYGIYMDLSDKQIQEYIIATYGTERKDLESYNCGFDESKHKYTGIIHKHRVDKAWDINMMGYIYHGIAFKEYIGTTSIIKFGCPEKFFDKKLHTAE